MLTWCKLENSDWLKIWFSNLSIVIMISVFSRYQRDSSGASHSSVRSFKARLYLTEKKRLKIVGWYFKDTMLKKSDGWRRGRRAASPDTEFSPINRRHPERILGHGRVSEPKEPGEQTVGMLITFPKAQRFMKLSGDVKKCCAVSWAASWKIDDMKEWPLFCSVSKEGKWKRKEREREKTNAGSVLAE